MTPALQMPRIPMTTPWLHACRTLRRAVGTGVLIIVACATFAMAESRGQSLIGIQQAKRATVGVLQPGDDAQRVGVKAHFVMRGTALHLRDGYLLTARHVAEQDEAGR